MLIFETFYNMDIGNQKSKDCHQKLKLKLVPSLGNLNS